MRTDSDEMNTDQIDTSQTDTSARGGIALALTGEQRALIIVGLAERPFKQVFELIGMLHAGARQRFSPDQLRMMLDTLGGMPFAKVNRLLQSMHQQMRMDLACMEPACMDPACTEPACMEPACMEPR